MKDLSRIPLGRDEIVLLDEPELTPPVCAKLLRFYRDFHNRSLSYFIRLREDWHLQNPGQFFPGLCANVNPLTGDFRPSDEQRLWGWGDTRALGTWSSFLITNRVPHAQVELALTDGSSKSVDLNTAMQDYVDIIYSGLMARILKNKGNIPFSAHIQTGLPDDNPKNSFLNSSLDKTAGEFTDSHGNAFAVSGPFDFSKAFAVNGLMQYGILKVRDGPLQRGFELLGELTAEIESERNSRAQAPRMVALGVIGDVLKTIDYLCGRGEERYRTYREPLVQAALPLVQYLLDHHFRRDPPAFWEEADPEGNPLINEDGHILVDPGHATECAGFLAECVPFLPPAWGSDRWDREKVLRAALQIHLFADEIGFTKSGVMTKYADLLTAQMLPDTQAAGSCGRPTAPWFNIREHCAAALRLYTLTGDARLLSTYRKAQNATYLVYPNKRIGGMLVQTVDPITLEALDIAPATGNLDPMHDGRARVREMENLELIGSGKAPCH